MVGGEETPEHLKRRARRWQFLDGVGGQVPGIMGGYPTRLSHVNGRLTRMQSGAPNLGMLHLASNKIAAS